ncbi:hypothetical protein SMC26_26515 [Actinomadura fulvescens]|uniref:Uncharacterized protein n=1 Tax=Actinomadura fulvescens TaxID=46160 RepID=A0ABP6CHC6_9ACTN
MATLHSLWQGTLPSRLKVFLLARTLGRIEAEPDVVQRSILVMREDDLDPEPVAGLGPLESDPRIVRQVKALCRAMVTTTNGIAPEAFWPAPSVPH